MSQISAEPSLKPSQMNGYPCELFRKPSPDPGGKSTAFCFSEGIIQMKESLLIAKHCKGNKKTCAGCTHLQWMSYFLRLRAYKFKSSPVRLILCHVLMSQNNSFQYPVLLHSLSEKKFTIFYTNLGRRRKHIWFCCHCIESNLFLWTGSGAFLLGQEQRWKFQLKSWKT